MITPPDKWELAIREARALVPSYSKNRFKIVEVAKQVCDLNHGGRKTTGVYTIAQFARAIEVNPKTLYEWMRVKRLVVDKLPKTYLTKNKTSYDDLAETANKVTPDSSKKAVLEAMKAQRDVPVGDKKFLKYRDHINGLLYNAERPMLLLHVDKELIGEIIKRTTKISSLLRAELKLRKKLSVDKRIKQNEVARAQAITEVLAAP